MLKLVSFVAPTDGILPLRQSGAVGQTSIAKRDVDPASEEHFKAGSDLIREGRTRQGIAQSK